MKRFPLRGLLIATIALATTAFTLTDTPPDSEAPSVETLTLRTSHQVTITYGRRNATIQVTPIRGQRAPWRGDLAEGAVYASGRWTTFKFEKTGEGFEAVAQIPEFQLVEAFAILTDSRTSYTWVEEDWPMRARADDEPDNDEKPEEPAPEDPPEDEPCNMIDIRDPWTGECGASEMKDPWEDEEVNDPVVTLSI